MTSKDHRAWYLPMVLAGGVGTPELHEAFGRVADIVKDAVAGSTLTANLTGPAATGDDLTYIGIRDMHVIETAVALMVLIILFIIYRNPATMLLPLITIGISLVTAPGHCGWSRPTWFGRFHRDDHVNDDDDGGRRD